MTTYTEFTETLAQQWETALNQLQAVQSAALAPWIRAASGLIPDVDVPFADRLPSQKEIVEANFRFAERALESQRAYTVALFDAAASAAQKTTSDSRKSASSKK